MTRLTLPKDQWIDVKDRTSVQDEEDKNSFSSDGVSTDGLTMRYSIVRHHIGMAAVYIKKWSEGMVDEDGKQIHWPIGKSLFKERVKAIRLLDSQLLNEITVALDGHVTHMKSESEDEKKDTPDGETDSGPNLRSVN